MPLDLPIVLDEVNHRFDVVVDGHTAYIEFERFDGGIAYTHTIVPEAVGGRGIGSALVEHALTYARQRHLKVRPDCSFVKAYIDKHPQHQATSTAHGAAA